MNLFIRGDNDVPKPGAGATVHREARYSLDGILHEIDPTAAGFSPIGADIFSWTDAQRANIKSLPSSLGEALGALETDHDFLLTGDVFSQELIRQWIDYKLEAEYYPVRNRPHPYEVQLYFDV
jgi:glutamine synthetase